MECSLDMVTTEEPTSEMTSSQTPETTSQEPMTSMPTSHIVTSSPTEPPNTRLHFEVKDGSTVCLVLDGVFSFMIPYMKKDNTVSTCRCRSTIVVAVNCQRPFICTICYQIKNAYSFAFHLDFLCPNTSGGEMPN